MKLTRIGRFALGFVALALLVWLCVVSQPVDGARVDALRGALSEVQDLEVEWDAALWRRTQTERAQPVDALASLERVDQAFSALRARPAWSLVSGDPAVEVAATDYVATVAEKRRAAQELRDVQLHLDQTRRAVLAAARPPKHARGDGRLSSADATLVSSVEAQLSAEERERVVASLLGERGDDDEARRPNLALRQALEELADEDARRAELLATLTSSSLRTGSRAVAEACDAFVRERQAQSDRHRWLLYGYALLLLVQLFHSFREREAAVRQLDQTRASLEERVRERTEELSRKNDELAGEIRERQTAEHKLRLARRSADAANRTKSEFLANMSHEIRTPMTSILGYAERLDDDDLSLDERRDAVATVRRSGEYLLQLLNDILDISKIEAGKLQLERIECSPAQILFDVQDAMEVRATAKGLSFKLDLPEALPETIHTDPMRLKQVLINLLGNAIKFTETGGIVLRVGFDVREDASGSAGLVFAVTDTGIGMDPAQIECLFRPFTQAESSTSRRFGGTGLGLSICKTLVEMMGGKISVNSVPGEGSTFTFRVDTGPTKGVKLLSAENVLGLREGRDAERIRHGGVHLDCPVLLAEDGIDNQRLLVHFLRKAGAEVDVAGDGHQAVERALAAQADGRPYHVVIMDMQMPRLNGYDATARLRAAGYKLPIVALTANAMVHERTRCIDAGCDDYCTKPIDKYRFLSAVARWASKVQRSTSPTVAAADRSSMIQTTFRTLVKASSNDIEPFAFRSAPARETPPVAPAKVEAQPVAREPEPENDPEMLELVRLFVADLSRDLTQMTEAVETNDFERLAFLAHQLKGSAGSYGFPQLTEQAARLERCARGDAQDSHVEIELETFARLCRELETPAG